MVEYFNIGKLMATHGTKGQLILAHSLGKNVPFEQLKWIFISQNNSGFLPYAVENVFPRNENEILVKIEDVENKEDAKKFVKKEVWITETDFRNLSSKSSPISWLGFTVMDGKNAVGIIKEIIEQPHQILCTIMIEEKEAYIPIHEDTLLKVDAKNKRIHVDIPAGLLEIYRNG